MAASEPHPNSEEVDDYKWLSWDDFLAQTDADTEDVWSWWCKDQIKQLRESDKLAEFLATFV